MPEEGVQRRLAAILVADMVGYSRLMGEDEAGTLMALKVLRADVIDPLITAHHGRVVKLMGDGTLVEFASVIGAVECAMGLQREMAARNNDVLPNRRIEFRVGVNLGDVIPEGHDIYGDGVNVAARLERLAEPSGICVSGGVHDAIGRNLAAQFEFTGEQWIKNIEKPIRVYRMTRTGETGIDSRPAARGIMASVPRQNDRPTLAVKPFESAGRDRDLDQFAGGLTSGIITALTRTPHLALIQDETPSFAASKGMSGEELARRFNVRYLLKGAVRRLGERVRVNAELIEVATGRYLWAEKFDRNLGDLVDLFHLQDEIIGEIVVALDVKLVSGEAARLVRKAFRQPAALENYHRGEVLLWRATNRLEMHEARRNFEEAIRLEPEVSVGYAGAALAHWLEAVSGMSSQPAQSLEQAMEMARRALELDDVTGYPHLIMAHVHLNRREFDLAMAAADRSVWARPSCPTAYALKASVLNYLGQAPEATEFAQYAVRLTPASPPPFYPAILASAHHGCERHEDAIAAARASIDLDEEHVEPYLILAASSAASGRVEQAGWAGERVRKMKPDFSLASYAPSQPFKDPKNLDRLLEQLRSAGLN